MFDDYVELDPGAAVELQRALQKRYTLSEQAGAGGKAISRFVQRIFNILCQQDAGQRQLRSDAELGGYESQVPSFELAPIADVRASRRECENSEQAALRLLLYVDDRTAKTTLKQEILRNINDDRELFFYLRSQYFTKWSWFSLRSIGALSLAQVGLPKQIRLCRF